MAAQKQLTPAKAAAMSKNPGTRSKVPTAQLSPKYRAMRNANAATKAKNAALDDPQALTAPLTPRTLNANVQAATNLYAQPAEQDIATRQHASDQAAQAIPSWFAQYQAALQNATDQTKQAYAGAAAISQNAANSSSALDATQQQAQQAQMQQTAAVGGSQVNPAVAQMAQQASASRRAGTDAQTALTAGLGATNVAYRANRQATGAGEQAKAQLDEGKRRRGINAEGTALAAKKGDYAATTRQKMIDAEHTKQLENKAYGLNVAKAQTDEEIRKAALAEKTSNDAATVQTRKTAITTAAATAKANRDSSAAVRAADRASREREGHLTRLTRKATAATIASSGVTPAEQRQRNDALGAVDKSRAAADATAASATQVTKNPSELHALVQRRNPSASKEAVDAAVAKALGSKGDKKAEQRYRQYLKDIATGKRRK